MSVISFDTETYYDDECSVRDLGPDKYSGHPAWECYLVSVCNGEETWVGSPQEFNWGALESNTLVSHNAAFDQAMFLAIPETWPLAHVSKQLVSTDWHCTANLSTYLSGHRALDSAVQNFYHKKVDKTLRDYMKGKRWADVPPDKKAQIVEYARHDAYWCWKLWNDLSSQWPANERRLSQITIEQGRRGVAVDTELLAKYKIAADTELFNIQKSLPWIERGAKPTSTKAIAEECRREGIACPPVKSDDEDGFIEWEKQFKPLYPWVAAVANWRSVNKVLKTLDTFKERLRPDDTVEVLLKYFGGHTGRFSGDGGLNFQNFRKSPLVCAEVPIDMRALLVPRPGKKFIVCDLGQIEPRVLAWLVGNEELLAIMRQGINAYEAFARQTGKWQGNEELKKGDKRLYALSKVQVLQLGYQCGSDRFRETAATPAYGVVLTEQESADTVAAFRAQNPGIVDLWGTLQREFRNSLKGDFEMTLPSGRVMKYRNVNRQVRPRTQPDGTITREWTWVADIVKSGRNVRLPFYGGMLTENLVQATARDVFAEHLLALDKAGFDVPFHSHDEAIVEVDLDVKPRDIEVIMSVTPEWLENCPIAAEAVEAQHYLK